MSKFSNANSILYHTKNDKYFINSCLQNPNYYHENMYVNVVGCKARMHFFNILKHKVLTEVNAVRMSRQLCANECKRENCIIQ